MNLGNLLHGHYQRTHLQDLEAAVARSHKRCGWPPEDHPDLASCLSKQQQAWEPAGQPISTNWRSSGLGCCRCTITGSSAVDTSRSPQADRAAWLNSLGNRLASRFERTWDVQDLEAAIAWSQEAVRLTPEDNAHRTAHHSPSWLHMICKKKKKTLTVRYG